MFLWHGGKTKRSLASERVAYYNRSVSARIAYAPIFGLRAVSLCFYILPPGA